MFRIPGTTGSPDGKTGTIRFMDPTLQRIDQPNRPCRIDPLHWTDL
jgi:hypothetical protein